jgi:hypothetical protein
LAVDGDFNFYTYNGSFWSAAKRIDASSSGGIVTSEVSCASATFCEGAFGHATATYHGSGWSTPIGLATGAAAKGASAPSIEAISCPSPAFCAGAGRTGNNEAYLSTFNGTSWSAPVIKTTTFGPQGFTSVSCPRPSFCMAPGLDGWVTWTGSSWSAPHAFFDPGGPLGAGPLYANSVSCTSSQSCEEVENNGYADSWKG